jgi:protein phosphatase 1 regulatory subunit 7
MRHQDNIDGLIKDTNEQYARRIETEKARKDLALRYMQKHEADVKEKFERYRDDMNKSAKIESRCRDLGEFVNYVNFVRRKRELGEEIEVTPEFLQKWRTRLQDFENVRKAEEEQARHQIDEKYNSLILTKLINTTYSDKLYQIAMDKPELWRQLKRKEYESRMHEEQDFAAAKINDRFRLLTQGLEKEQYLNHMIDQGQQHVLHNIQSDLPDVLMFVC